MNGCTYVLHAGEELSEPGDFQGTLDLKCPSEKKIVIAGSNCEVQISGQNGMSSLEYDDNPEATPDNVTMWASLSKIKYTKAIDGSGCPLTGTGGKEDGTYSGTFLVTGEAAEEQKGVAVNQAPNTKLCEKEPKPTCNDLFPAGTRIEGKVEKAEAVVFVFREQKGKEEKGRINCEKGEFSAETEAKEGVPLKAVSLSIEKNCKTEGMGTTCTKVKMQNAPALGTIRWEPFSAFSGYLTVNTFAVRLECGTELKCEYVKAPLQVAFYGGASGTLLLAEEGLIPTPIPEEKKCYPYGEIYTSIPPSKAVWITK